MDFRVSSTFYFRQILHSFLTELPSLQRKKIFSEAGCYVTPKKQPFLRWLSVFARNFIKSERHILVWKTLILFKSPRDSSQVNHLAKQMFPGHVKYMQEAFQDATKRPYGYLLCDLKPETPSDFRLRSNIFPGETQCAYVRKV